MSPISTQSRRAHLPAGFALVKGTFQPAFARHPRHRHGTVTRLWDHAVSAPHLSVGKWQGLMYNRLVRGWIARNNGKGMVARMVDQLRSVMLIPSLEPDERLPRYVAALLAAGFPRVVVVDDGSGPSYQPIFQALEEMPGCTVLHHPVNRGKGCALKTGFAWIRTNCPQADGVITADADGQHTVPDCLKISQALEQGKQALYLGSRDFSLAHVPPKSRFGNRLTSFVFMLLYGRWLQDTQTGLRGFPVEQLAFMEGVAGERFEYEMNVLISCARAGLPMIPIGIETVYENDNAGTHFHPIRDSMRIYKVIFGSFFRFAGASILSFLIDQGGYWLFSRVLLLGMGLNRASLIWVSGVLARLVSSVCNFLLNRHLVFKLKGSAKQAVWRYAVLCVAIIALSNLGVTMLSAIGVNDRFAKVVCDTLLYFLSFRMQDRWVFQEVKAHA